MKWSTHLVHLQLHTLSREPVVGNKEGFLKSKHEMHTEWEVDISPVGLNKKAQFVCAHPACFLKRHTAFDAFSHQSIWSVESVVFLPKMTVLTLAGNEAWQSLFLSPAPPRLIKKLEHSWKALVYDGVSGSTLVLLLLSDSACLLSRN